MVLADSNILIDLFTQDKDWGAWSEKALYQVAQKEEIAINPIIYAEISIAFETPVRLDDILHRLGIVQSKLPYAAGFLAGKAFLRYRRSSGEKRAPLPDFYIGAHAQFAKWSLLTRDASRYQTYFPKIKLITPDT